MTDSLSGPDVPVEPISRKAGARGLAPGSRWVVLGSGAAAVLSVLGVLVVSPGDRPAELAGQPLAALGPVDVPLPAGIPKVPLIPDEGFGGRFSFDGLPGSVLPAPLPSPDPGTPQDAIPEVRAKVVLKVIPKPSQRAANARDGANHAVPAANIQKPAQRPPTQPPAAQPQAAQPQPAQPRPAQPQAGPSHPAYPSRYGNYPNGGSSCSGHSRGR
jgi:hypothetical protein